MFKICESLVIHKVYDVIVLAKDYKTLKGLISNYDNSDWLDYFYDKLKDKIQTCQQKVKALSTINPRIVQLD